VGYLVDKAHLIAHILRSLSPTLFVHATGDYVITRRGRAQTNEVG
jgi:hypothetical protein